MAATSAALPYLRKTAKVTDFREGRACRGRGLQLLPYYRCGDEILRFLAAKIAKNAEALWTLRPLRLTIFDRQSSILEVFNLRGNCRTSGEQRRKESGNVFGEGSRTPIAITILVRKGKTPAALNAEDTERRRRGEEGAEKVPARIYYRDIGDYLTREDKLRTIQDVGSILSDKMELTSIEPNEAGDWINQRDGLFDTFIPLGDKNAKNMNTIFVPCYSCGVKTNRDTWVYNFSRQALERNITSMIGFYNSNIDALSAARKDGSSVVCGKSA